MKRLGVIATCFLMLFAVVSCDDDCICDENVNYLKVLAPVANQTFSQDFSIVPVNKVSIEVTFNQAVDPATVVNGQTLLLESDGNPVDVTFVFNADKTIMTITTVPSVSAFCTFNPDCGFSLTLVGTDVGSGAIKDENGNALDGDKDDVEGGNWTTAFGILG